MTFGDQISGIISNIYDTISSYPDSAQCYKQDLEEILASLHFLLLKFDNRDKEVDIQAFNVTLDHVPKQINAAIKGRDPFKYLPNLSKYVNPKRRMTQTSNEELIKKINDLCEKYMEN